MKLAERQDVNHVVENLRWAIEHEAPSSNRGCMVYKFVFKTLKELNSCEAPEGTFKFLSRGFDSLQECFTCRFTDKIVSLIEQQKKEASIAGHELSLGFNLPFWGDFQVCSRGTKGVQYILLNDKIQIFISDFKTDWGVSVRYLSSALWQFGTDLLRLEVHTLIKEWSKSDSIPEDYHRLSRVDTCIDFLCDKMPEYMEPNIVKGFIAPAKVRIREDESLSFWLKSGYMSTLTLGSKTSLEIQIYDKAREIHEKSKKEFMFDVWKQSCANLSGYEKKGIWRFEVRFFAPFLRNRMVRTFEQFVEYQKELISEALTLRRLTVPQSSDRNRSRWPYHPIYSFVRRMFLVGKNSLPIGRYVTDARDVALERAVKQLAGSLRTYTVLKNYGIYDEDEMILLFQLSRLELQKDKRHQEKIERARERYKYVDCAA